MLKRIIFIFSMMVFLTVTSPIVASNVNLQAKKPDVKSEELQPKADFVYKDVEPLTLVAQPQKYLNQRIRMKAKFDKFSALGLDYEPVNRAAKAHISFLIKRDNVTNYNIPLSELKLILKRDYAEKALVNIESGDEIVIYGNVFSIALGDPWVDVEKVVIVTVKNKKDDANKGK